MGIIKLDGYNTGIYISEFVGTTKDAKGNTIWYTRYFPLTPNRLSTWMVYSAYDFSELPNFMENQLLDIGFSFIHNEDPRINDDLLVSVNKSGQKVELTNEEIESYLMKHRAYDHTSFIHVIQLENELQVMPQRSLEVDLSKFYWDKKYDYEEFKSKMLSWYH